MQIPSRGRLADLFPPEVLPPGVDVRVKHRRELNGPQLVDVHIANHSPHGSRGFITVTFTLEVPVSRIVATVRAAAAAAFA